jgi:hypothetical protein
MVQVRDVKELDSVQTTICDEIYGAFRPSLKENF